MSRPNKEFSVKTFENLCAVQCTQQEICDILDTTDKTLTAWCKRTYELSFSEIYKKKSASGKMSLRRYQFKQAEKNASMAIWLGKQYLNQKDRQELDHQSSDGSMTPISISFEDFYKNET